jgi:hypothetical protein
MNVKMGGLRHSKPESPERDGCAIAGEVRSYDTRVNGVKRSLSSYCAGMLR